MKYEEMKNEAEAIEEHIEEAVSQFRLLFSDGSSLNTKRDRDEYMKIIGNIESAAILLINLKNSLVAKLYGWRNG